MSDAKKANVNDLLMKVQDKGSQVESKPEAPKLSKGEVRFSLSHKGVLSTYVGIKRISFPHTTSDPKEIEELTKFAEHYETVLMGPSLVITEGE